MHQVEYADGTKTNEIIMPTDNTDDLLKKIAERKEKELKDPKVVQVLDIVSDGNLVLYPNPILRQKCSDVTEFNDDLKKFTERMFEVLTKFKGIGLAAPQIGLPVNLFVTNADGQERIFINPEIECFGKVTSLIEGCLSLPGVEVSCKRASKVSIKYMDLNKNEIKEEFTGLLAKIIQHEFEHLRGRLISDRLGLADSILNKRQLDRLRKLAKEQKEKDDGKR